MCHMDEKSEGMEETGRKPRRVQDPSHRSKASPSSLESASKKDDKKQYPQLDVVWRSGQKFGEE